MSSANYQQMWIFFFFDAEQIYCFHQKWLKNFVRIFFYSTVFYKRKKNNNKQSEKFTQQHLGGNSGNSILAKTKKIPKKTNM